MSLFLFQLTLTEMILKTAKLYAVNQKQEFNYQAD